MSKEAVPFSHPISSTWPTEPLGRARGNFQGAHQKAMVGKVWYFMIHYLTTTTIPQKKKEKKA